MAVSLGIEKVSCLVGADQALHKAGVHTVGGEEEHGGGRDGEQHCNLKLLFASLLAVCFCLVSNLKYYFLIKRLILLAEQKKNSLK
jgi:hypothetical protein